MAGRNDNSPDVQDDPEVEVRRRVVSQLQPPGATPDPVFDNPVDTRPPAPPTVDSTPTTGPSPTGPKVTVNPVTPPVGTGTVTPQGDREPTPPTPPDTTGQPAPTGPTGPTAPPAGGPPVTPGFRDAVTALYQKYYQRNPTEAELQAHAGNPGGIDAVETMLRANGGNATTPTGPTAPPAGAAGVLAHIQAFAAAHPNANPSITRDPNYWVQRIMQTHPDGNIDWGYWEGRMLQAEGAPEGASRPTGSGAGLTAPTGFQMQPIGGGGGGGQQSQGFWTPDFTNQIRQILLQRLQAAGQPVDENAPGIAGAVTAARDEATRQSTTERNALAERLYAQGGLNTNALTQQIQQSGERNASAVGSIRAQLILKEVNQRRQELDSLLQMATASGDAESARQIQMQIALLNKQVQEEGLNLDAQKYSAYLNQNAAEAGLRG